MSWMQRLRSGWSWTSLPTAIAYQRGHPRCRRGLCRRYALGRHLLYRARPLAGNRRGVGLTMPKLIWHDLIESFPEAHLVVAVLPDRSGEESIENGQATQQLLIRFLKKLPIQGDYAVTILRHDGRREIVCAFRDLADAEQVARAIGFRRTASRGRPTNTASCCAHQCNKRSGPSPARQRRIKFRASRRTDSVGPSAEPAKGAASQVDRAATHPSSRRGSDGPDLGARGQV